MDWRSFKTSYFSTEVLAFSFLTDELEILVAGVKQNISNLTSTGTLVPGAHITLIREINESIVALFPSGITVTFTIVSKSLAIAFDGTDVFKNRTRGLLGTWNDDPTDDFTTPDGTVLPADASPQQIHYDFGLKCEALCSSLLTSLPIRVMSYLKLWK